MQALPGLIVAIVGFCACRMAFNCFTKGLKLTSNKVVTGPVAVVSGILILLVGILLVIVGIGAMLK